MARRVDDVDVRVAVLDRAVLRQDRDPALALDVVAVHHALGDVLVVLEGAGLLQQLVDQRGLAVVDVGDDGDVANVACHGKQCGEKGRAVYHDDGCNSLNFRIMRELARDAQKQQREPGILPAEK